MCATIELFAQDPVVISPRSPIQLTVDHVDHQITVVYCCCYWSMVVDAVVISPTSPIQLTVDHVDHQIATAYCYHMVADVRMLKTQLHEQFHLLLAACVRLLFSSV